MRIICYTSTYYYVYYDKYMYKSKKGKTMDINDEKTIEKLKNIFELSLILHDSINFNWNEGMQGYYQLALSNIITKNFTEFFENIDDEYVNVILQRM